MENNWIENTTGECPVAKGTLIDVEFRDGKQLSGISALVSISGSLLEATGAFWVDEGCPNDIVKWRLHKPEQSLDDAFGNSINNHKLKYPQTTYKPSCEAQLRSDEAARVSNLLSEKLSTIADIASKLTQKNFSVADIKLVKDLMESVEEYEENK